MDKTKEQLEKLREVAEASLTKTDELQKVLAQIEALMNHKHYQRRNNYLKNNFRFCTFNYTYTISL